MEGLHRFHISLKLNLKNVQVNLKSVQDDLKSVQLILKHVIQLKQSR